jgi:ribonuclease P protein component
MLKKGFRITKQEDFDRAFRSGKPLFFGEIGCKGAKNGLDHIRLGFSFSKKHVPLAVDRNRLRRILSEAFAAQEAAWPDPMDIVFFSTKKTAVISLNTAKNLVDQVLNKAHSL